MNCGRLALLACGIVALLAQPPRVVPRAADSRAAAPEPPRTVRIQVDVPEDLVQELHEAGYDWRRPGRWELAGDKLVLCYDVEEPHDGDALLRGAASGHGLVDPGSAAR
jgi:hypothetical protein